MNQKITTHSGVADCSQARNIVTHVPVLYWISVTPTIILAHPCLLVLCGFYYMVVAPPLRGV